MIFRYSLSLEVMEFTSIIIENRTRKFTDSIWFKILFCVFALLLLASLIFSGISIFYVLKFQIEQRGFNSTVLSALPTNSTRTNRTIHTVTPSTTRKPIWDSTIQTSTSSTTRRPIWNDI